ncbi:4'-phosphopantetheinyl transferase family protein [Saccharicrinis aurantiacus]|uniref:4'-phosphopantetheinyl transferase family protein n=1 Tax=Saccharicrinis aurantiacus TaxID=1849719 RepID=UPI002492D8BD|nr:4'-phosphopantetheinyl transferase superfamily protein [Saccharicrinis aurantiacus]
MDKTIKQFSLYRSGKHYNNAFSFQFNISSEKLNVKEVLHTKETLLYQELKLSSKTNFIHGRWAVKYIIQKVFNISMTDVLINKGIFGQPILCHPDLINWECSISHSKSMVYALVFPKAHPMAIDIEDNNHNFQDITKSQFTYNELSIGKTYLSDNVHLQLWIAKEALSKCLQTGLTSPLKIMEIDKISICNDYNIFTFKNFTQYKALIFINNNTFWCICLPLNTNVVISNYI